MPYVHVWPDRFAKSWKDGKEESLEVLTQRGELFPAEPYHAAFTKEYDTYAHFCPAIIDGVEFFPRLSVELPQDYVNEVRFYVVALDIDGPGHKITDEWYREQIEKLKGTPWEGGIRYRTRGGYRLVWELPRPIKVSEYLAVLKALRKEMSNLGIEVDELTEWSRCYGLPFVNRDGKDLRYELVIPENPMFPLSLLSIEDVEESRSIGQEIENHLLDLNSDIVEAGAPESQRYKLLFRIMSSLRNLSWLEEDLAGPIAHTINMERCSPPLPDKEVDTLVKSVWRAYEAGDIPIEEEVSKEKIVISTGKLDILVRQCIEALSKHPDIYVQQGTLSRIIGDQIQILPVDALRTALVECVEFVKLKKVQDEWIEIPTDPAKDLISCVYVDGRFPGIRELEQIRTLPGLRPDGTLLSEYGYDARTLSFLQPDFKVELPEKVTLAQAMSAKERLKELYVDFPFKKDYHRASAMAAMMTPVMRLAIEGPTPMFIFESPVPGAGKTLAAEMATIVATGAGPFIMAPTNEEETTKQITSQLLAGAKIIFIDNVERPLGGPSLDAALTSEWWTARLLKTNSMLRLKNTATWMATGNNIKLAGDIARRGIRIFIDPEMEHPEERDTSSFSHPNIKKYVLDNREDFVRDILLMARYRHQNSLSGYVKSMGSFESWSYWVRETLLILGEADCLESQKDLKVSTVVSVFGTFLSCALGVFQPRGKRSFVESEAFSPKDLHEVVFTGARRAGSQEQTEGLVAAFQELTESSSLLAMGRVLHKWSNRVVNGLRMVELPGTNTKTQLYKIQRVDGGAVQAETESSSDMSEACA